MERIQLSKSKRAIQNPQSLFLSVRPYAPDFVARVKSLPVRYYDPDTRLWEVPYQYKDAVLHLFPNAELVGFPEEVHLPWGFESLEDYEHYLSLLELQAPYTPKTKMDPHQVEWFNLMLERDKVLNADPMGLGKTKEYLDVCEWRKQSRGYEKILFVCGAKYTFNMLKQVALHTNSQAIVVNGTKEQRLQQLRDFYNSDAYYLIIGYEALLLHAEQIRILANRMGFDGVIVDESQKIRHFIPRKKGQTKHRTVQTVELLEYINPELVILGTGTPLSKKAEELYTPIRLLTEDCENIWAFRNKYCVFNHFNQIVGYKHLNDLKSRIDPIIIRRPKELLHLKEPRPEFVPLRMEGKQLSLYHACVMQLRSELKGTKALTAVELTKILRLRQITTNPKLVDSDAPSVKEAVVVDMVTEAVEREEKTIVYTISVEEVGFLRETLKEFNPAYIVGSMTARKAQAEVDRFQTDPDCKVMIGSLMACKESYDMYSASNVILMDDSYNWADNDQAIARAWRRGQENHVNITYLYCEGTVDESVLGIMAHDRRLADQLIGIEGKSVRTFDPDLIGKLLVSPKDKV